MRKAFFARITLIPAIILVSSFAFAQLDIADDFMFDTDGKISLDLKGMDIIEVLKTLASKGNMNLVVGSNVRGRVTMFRSRTRNFPL